MKYLVTVYETIKRQIEVPCLTGLRERLADMGPYEFKRNETIEYDFDVEPVEEPHEIER